MIFSYTLILRMSKLQTQQMMTWQIRSHIVAYFFWGSLYSHTGHCYSLKTIFVLFYFIWAAGPKCIVTPSPLKLFLEKLLLTIILLYVVDSRQQLWPLQTILSPFSDRQQHIPTSILLVGHRRRPPSSQSSCLPRSLHQSQPSHLPLTYSPTLAPPPLLQTSRKWTQPLMVRAHFNMVIIIIIDNGLWRAQKVLTWWDMKKCVALVGQHGATCTSRQARLARRVQGRHHSVDLGGHVHLTSRHLTRAQNAIAWRSVSALIWDWPWSRLRSQSPWILFQKMRRRPEKVWRRIKRWRQLPEMLNCCRKNWLLRMICW